LLAFHKPNAVIEGLDEEPKSDWPNVRAVHICFQIMVGCGSLLSVFAIASGWVFWKKRSLSGNRLVMKGAVLVAPLGFVALEAGWMVTELGRQPWIIYHLLRTKDAVTPMPYLSITFTVMTLIYLILAIVVAWLLSKHVIGLPVKETRDRIEVPV
jgi:cytochrome bd ubiquinol oxidase subunit I